MRGDKVPTVKEMGEITPFTSKVSNSSGTMVTTPINNLALVALGLLGVIGKPQRENPNYLYTTMNNDNGSD